MVEWHMLTGEYPPQCGGVSDYSRLIARGLADAGDEVHVWAPEHHRSDDAEPGIQIHRLPGHFGRQALAQLDSALRHPCSNRRLLVQYVPHAFGWKAMNVLFCLWVYRQRLRERIWVMFHEVAFPIRRGQLRRHNFLGCVTCVMARLLVRAAERCLVSTPAWIPWLRRLGGERGQPILWLPIPSNLPVTVDAKAVARIRDQYVPNPDQLLVGHFGTYGSLVVPVIAQVFPPVLAKESRRVGLLLGRGSDRVVPGLLQAHPEFWGRWFATGQLGPEALAAHLAACDLLIQPFPDGVSARRTTVMAGLALGVPIVTTDGDLTESVWREEKLVHLAPAASPMSLVPAAESLLVDPSARRDLGQRGQLGYHKHFQLARTIHLLQHADFRTPAPEASISNP